MRCLVALLLLSTAAHADCPPECGTLAPDELPVPETFAVTGTVVEHDGTTAIGATVVAQRDGATETMITDETGAFTLRLRPGTYAFAVFYVDAQLDLPGVVVEGDRVLGRIAMPRQATVQIEIRPCVLPLPYVVPYTTDLTAQPRHGANVQRDRPAISRDRTHRAWIAPVATADPNRSVTTLEGGHRFHAGIPIAFIEEVTTQTQRAAIDVAAGAGGATQVRLHGPSGRLAADARVVLGLDRDAATTTGLELIVGGPLRRTKAWLAVGLVADPLAGTTTGMAKIRYDPHARRSLVASAIASERDAWASTSWTSLLDDTKLVVQGVATAARLETAPPIAARAAAPLGSILERAGGRASLHWNRLGEDGQHTLIAMAEGGGGRRGDDSHADATWAIGDEWRIWSHVELHAGVRGHHRQFAGHRARVLAPRVSISYDHTEEKRSDLFVAYQRVSRLDDGLPGDWRAEPVQFHDELIVGAAYQLARKPALSSGLAARTRWIAADAELGLDAWLRWNRPRTMIHASATTLGRIAAVHALRLVMDREYTKVRTGLAVRADPTRTEGGLAVTWQRRGEDEHDSVELSAEGYAGTAGPGARVLVGTTW